MSEVPRLSPFYQVTFCEELKIKYSDRASKPKEFLQQLCAFAGQYAAAYLNFVIQCRMIQDPYDRVHGTSLRIVSPVN
jgi:hypothetical protein